MGFENEYYTNLREGFCILIKICVSYTSDEEKNEVLNLLKPMICKKTKIKQKAGEKYNRVYIIIDRFANEKKKRYNNFN